MGKEEFEQKTGSIYGNKFNEWSHFQNIDEAGNSDHGFIVSGDFI